MINYTLVGFIIYLIGVLVAGVMTYKMNKTHEDYLIAGRKLNPWVVAFSERASGESAWLLLGLPGLAMTVGLIGIWTALGCVMGIILSWFYIAKELRIQTEQYNSITLPNFFLEKTGGKSRAIPVLSMIIIVFFFTFYLAAQFNGAGKVLKVTFGIEPFVGALIGAVIIIFYTMMGGFFAVAWTDLIQGIIMIATLIILPIAGMIELAEHGMSLSLALKNANTAYIPIFGSNFQIIDWIHVTNNNFVSITGGKTGWALISIIIGGLSWGLGYFGQPHLLTRFMAIRSASEIKISRRIAIAWAIPAFAGAFAIGFVGLSLYGRIFADPEFLMPFIATKLLPSWIAGIFISGAVAAMMSTADSQLLVITSTVVEDFYHKALNKDVSQKKLLSLSRIVTVLIGIFGFILAVTSKKLIFSLVSYAWAGLGASFGPALILMLKWKKTTSQGVLAGMITGTMTTVIWSEIVFLDNFLSVRFTSFVFAFIAVIIVSILTQEKTISNN